MNCTYSSNLSRTLKEVLYDLFVTVALWPRRRLIGMGVAGVSLSITLILVGMMSYRPVLSASTAHAGGTLTSPLIPPDFTPVASPPPAFAQEVVSLLPTATPAATEVAAAPTFTPAPTATPVPPEALLFEGAGESLLQERRFISILILGTDARPDEMGASRTDAMMVATLDLEAHSLTLISIPRDLWVLVPGYGENRINTAYFLGEYRGIGPQVARQTVSQLLGIPIVYSLVVDFNAFREFVDRMGGIEIDVPEPIDDPFFPDDHYGTFRLMIPAGRQLMSGERALQYARTRHGSSDIVRASRQQAVLEALWQRAFTPEQLPQLPGYLREALSRVKTNLTLADLFFLARFAQGLDRERVHNHVLASPLLWDGMTADGQQVLLYDPISLQSSVQQWLTEAAQP